MDNIKLNEQETEENDVTVTELQPESEPEQKGIGVVGTVVLVGGTIYVAKKAWTKIVKPAGNKVVSFFKKKKGKDQVIEGEYVDQTDDVQEEEAGAESKD